MGMTDPIADMLTRIRNALKAGHRYVDLPWSKLKENIALQLKEEGFVQDCEARKKDNKTDLRIVLKYAKQREPAIRGLKRVSRPGRRKYVGHEEITKFFGGLGLSIISTSQGVLTGQEALKRKIGGEFICKVW